SYALRPQKPNRWAFEIRHQQTMMRSFPEVSLEAGTERHSNMPILVLSPIELLPVRLTPA
ncbi:MAG: hypothetical protein WBV36_22630, partial [Terriglobales bacterium]